MDSYRGLGTARDEDGVGDGGFDLDDVAFVVEVLDDPFVAVKFFAWGFLRPHALGLGLLTWYGRFAATGGR